MHPLGAALAHCQVVLADEQPLLCIVPERGCIPGCMARISLASTAQRLVLLACCCNQKLCNTDGLHPVIHIDVVYQITGRAPDERRMLDVSTDQIFYERTACWHGAGGQVQAVKACTGGVHPLDDLAPARRVLLSSTGGAAPGSAQPLEPWPETFCDAAGHQQSTTRGLGRSHWRPRQQWRLQRPPILSTR